MNLLADKWVTKREGFIARHMTQMVNNDEPLYDKLGRPTRRHLALIAWAFSPDPSGLRRAARNRRSQAARAAGDTMDINNPGCVNPASQTFGHGPAIQQPAPGTEAANAHLVMSLATNIPAPPSNTYSSIVFIKCTRRSAPPGGDTYPGNFGLLYVDMHALSDRPGKLLPGLGLATVSSLTD